MKGLRSNGQKLKDLVTFPLRAMTLFFEDRWGLSSLQTERYDYAARAVLGKTLDVGCGPHNTFVKEYLDGNGQGIDVFPYEGLSDEQIIADMTKMPFPDASFDTITFIANLNHIPEPVRDDELREAWRVLKPGGNLVATMGNPIAEVLVHKVVVLHDKLFGSGVDIDSERGMDPDEAYYLTTREIRSRLRAAGFQAISKKHFWTQWGLNHMFVAWKPRTSR